MPLMYTSMIYLLRFYRLANDNANFSINTDDPGVVGKVLSDEYALVINEMKLTEQQVIKAVRFKHF